jgi:hypothetical protein
MVKILMDNLAIKEQHNMLIPLTFLLQCLPKFCILEVLIYLEDTNIFNIQEPATASQLSRGYTYIFVVTLGVKP